MENVPDRPAESSRPADTRGQADREFVGGLARGLAVIECFGTDAPELTLTEVAARTGLTPATARRALLTLEALGYVRQNRRRFVLRSKVLRLGAAYLSSMNLKDLVQPQLQALNARFGDASSLTVLEGNDVVYLAHAAMEKRERRLRQSVGSRLPAHAASTGHVLLAHLPDPARAAYLAQAPFPSFTANTPTDAATLQALCDATRANGHALVRDVIEYGVLALAVPIRDAAGRVFAAINCSADSMRTRDEEMLATRLPALRAAANEIGEALARFPALAHSTGI
ncbi:IclR family transcriptional regulator domain-containing protein [Elioraea rosea]|uniref:IclR family transcriptional regulator domain-containing protein n=1 Tax=Elioraea rosea TaxID=2492390 RepID=UPI0011837B1B|nr:IclR family transcriptional regulator C-terminal domain-containing protein [Elioraea rosea]